MTVSAQPLSGSRVKLTIDVDEELLSKAKVSAAARLSERVRIPGFRPGKASVETVRRHIGEEAWKDEMVEDAIGRSYPLALREKEVRVVAKPEKVELLSFEPFRYEVTVPVYPVIDLGKYNKIVVQQAVPRVTDEEVQKEVEDILAALTTYTAVDRSAQTKDQLIIDFIAHDHEDKVVPGTQGEEMECIIGSDRFIGGFEKQVVGTTKGETKKFPITFPADYASQDLKGKTVTFTVTVREVREPSVPVLDEDFIEKISGKRESKETFLSNIRSRLTREKTEQERNIAEEKVVEELLKTCRGEVPQALIDEERSDLLETLKSDLKRRGTSMERFLALQKKTYDQLADEYGKTANERVMMRFILREIADQEKISVTDTDMEGEIEKIVSAYHADFQDKARDLYQKEKPAREHLANRLEIAKIFDLFIRVAHA